MAIVLFLLHYIGSGAQDIEAVKAFIRDGLNQASIYHTYNLTNLCKKSVALKLL